MRLHLRQFDKIMFTAVLSCQSLLLFVCLLTRRGDAAHLNGTGNMAGWPTLWVHDGPLLSSDQVTHHTLGTNTHT